jgi:hypothetical protein
MYRCLKSAKKIKKMFQRLFLGLDLQDQRPVLKSFNVDVNPFIVELYVIKFDDKPV